MIFSIYGAGALKIGRGERPIVNTPLSNNYGYNRSNEEFQYTLGTNFFNHNLHIIDLHKGRQINQPLKNILHNAIIDVCFFNLGISNQCACIDNTGKIATYNITTHESIHTGTTPNSVLNSAGIDFNANESVVNDDQSTKILDKIETIVNFESRLKHVPQAIGCSFDNEYLMAVSDDEFVLFGIQPLRFVCYYVMEDVEWDSMMVMDKYFYGLLGLCLFVCVFLVVVCF